MGAFKKVKIYGKKKLASWLLKKDISSKIFKIIPKLKKAKQIKANFK